MLINQKAIKMLGKDKGKQLSKEFIGVLDKIVHELIMTAMDKGKNLKRITEKELLM